MAKERIGILSGTFDPVHQGQIRTALAALDLRGLDQVVMVLREEDGCAAGYEDRWRMTVTACAQDRRLLPVRANPDASGSSAAADILLLLKREHPRADFYWILDAAEMGDPRFQPLPKEAVSLCSFLICAPEESVLPDSVRKEKDRLAALGEGCSVLRTPRENISSARIRDQLACGSSSPGLYSPVREYCSLKGLYGLPASEPRAEEWIGKLFEALNPRRFSHSLSVAEFSCRLARLHGIDPRRAEQAGILHDCAKCMPLKEMQDLAVRNSLTDDPATLSSNALLHSLAGAWVAQHEYGMDDPQVLEAIAWHNTGHEGMSRLAMCVCLADSIEPTRESYPLLEQIRALSQVSLERALLLSLESTADFVLSRGKFLHPRTQETIAWLKTLPEIRGADTEAIKAP